MKIIVAGAGKVGFYLAKSLSIAHEVIVIDHNAAALERISEQIDILPIKGDAATQAPYTQFLYETIDLFIAVTNIDAVNVLAVAVADGVLHIKRRFARLQKHFEEADILRRKFALDQIVFPVKLASASTALLLDYPRANNVKHFRYTQEKLFSIRIEQADVLKAQEGFCIVAIERNRRFFVPKTQSLTLQAGDLVYMFGKSHIIERVCKRFDTTSKTIRRCVVYGADDLGIAIAEALLEKQATVKIVEKDVALCEKAAVALKGRAVVVNAKYDSHTLYEEEGLAYADMFIATTHNDEFNIIKSLEAKEKGIKKIVSINNDNEYYNLMHAQGIVVVRGPKMSAYHSIIEEINSTNVVIHKQFCGQKGVVFMRKIFPGSALIKKRISPPDIESTVCVLIRHERLSIVREPFSLEAEDVLGVFGVATQNLAIQRWIYGL